ncbi:hypothetical protein DFH06DRAFT_1157844 [Mycena polygramma]|nr:hypothetical protein C8R47DRAFT_354108 [Mycena vitilis]KAJ7685218.1 hypothetical protein DFH06DRAFT_1157844 [Mycena polygramma]
MAEVHKYEFNVQMTCGGCTGAVNRVLKKAQEADSTEVSDYSVTLENKTVLVTGTIPSDKLVNIIAKTGKKINSATKDGETLDVTVA